MVIETKYNIGDIVYFMNSNTVCHDIITKITITSTKEGEDHIIYLLEKYSLYKEDFLFKSKHELLKSL